MKQIRYNVFETNSSSMHSLSLSNHNPYDADFDGNLIIGTNEFGWEKKKYETIHEKLSYLRAYCLEYDGKGSFGIYSETDFIDRVRQVFPKVRNITLEKGDEVYEHGYIDHQSNNLLEEEEVSFEEFLTEPYILITDNDNY